MSRSNEYDRRFAAASRELDDAGIRGLKAIPPETRILRRLGLSPRPPSYKPLLWYFASEAVIFAVLYSVLLGPLFRTEFGRPITDSLVEAGIASLVYAAGMTAIQLRRRKRHRLSRWDQL